MSQVITRNPVLSESRVLANDPSSSRRHIVRRLAAYGLVAIGGMTLAPLVGEGKGKQRSKRKSQQHGKRHQRRAQDQGGDQSPVVGAEGSAYPFTTLPDLYFLNAGSYFLDSISKCWGLKGVIIGNKSPVAAGAFTVVLTNPYSPYVFTRNFPFSGLPGYSQKPLAPIIFPAGFVPDSECDHSNLLRLYIDWGRTVKEVSEDNNIAQPPGLLC